MNFKMRNDGTVDDVFDDFTADGSDRDGTMVGWLVAVSFLVDRGNLCTLTVIWYTSLVNRGLEDSGQGWSEFDGSLL